MLPLGKKVKISVRILVDLTDDDELPEHVHKSNEIQSSQAPQGACENSSALQRLLAKSAEFCVKLEAENRRKDTLILDRSRYIIRQSDMDKLQPGNWLNDELVHAFIARAVSKSNNYYVFSSYFLEKYIKALGRSSTNVNSIETSTTLAGEGRKGPDENLLAKDLLVFPIHDRSHWSIAICVFNSQTDNKDADSKDFRGKLYFLDSLGDYHDKEMFAHVIRCYLNSLNKKFSSSWRDQTTEISSNNSAGPYILANDQSHFNSSNLPVTVLESIRQADGCNCGVFAISNVNRFVDSYSDWRTSGTNFDHFESSLVGRLHQEFDPNTYRVFLKRELLQSQCDGADMSCRHLETI